VQYTVWSGNRQIGVTDLGFRYRKGGSRTGWFFPVAESEGLMPKIVDPLIGNYMPRKRARSLEPFTAQEWTRLAEYEEACRRAAAWDLRLRREDGSPVATESVGIRDVEALLACYPDDIFDGTDEDELQDGCDFYDDDPSEAWKRDSPTVDDDDDTIFLREMENDDLIMSAEWLEHPPESVSEWEPEDEGPMPRYQIFVLLSDPSAVP